MNFDTTQAVLAIAYRHLTNDCASVCYGDALTYFDRGDYERATKRALHSLHYAVGTEHPDYCAAAAFVKPD